MAQKIGRQGEWPTVREDKTAFFATPDGYLKSGRQLAGGLRLGTEPRVGPRGAGGENNSDFGVDRLSPRGFDPIGTALDRYGAQESSDFLSGQRRR